MPDSSLPVPLSLFDGQVCRRCGVWKRLTRFNVSQGCIGGRQPTCKDCFNVPAFRAARRQRPEVREQERAAARQYSAERRQDPAFVQIKRERDRDYYRRNAEKVKAAVRAYAEANPEKIKARSESPEQKARVRAYDASPEGKAARAAYRQTERWGELRRAGGRRRYHADLDASRLKGRLNQHRRRVAGKLTPAEWLAICAAYEHTCAYCGEAKPLQIDHVTPVTKGGLTTRDNIVPACEFCNKSKQDKAWTPRPPVHPPHFD